MADCGVGAVGTVSELRDLMDSYLTTRRALGFKLVALGKTLNAFVSWMDERGERAIWAELAASLEAYAARGGGGGTGTEERFCQVLKSLGDDLLRDFGGDDGPEG